MPFTKTRLDEEAISRLVALYKETAQKLLDSFDSTTDFGRAKRLALLAQIDEELKKLGIKTQDWLDKEIAAAYKLGTSDADFGLKTLISKGALGKDAIPIKGSFTQPNKQQIQALIDDTSKSFGEALTNVSRNVRAITTQAFQRELRTRIAEGVLSTQSRKEIVDGVKQQLRERGLTALTDRGGKSWSIDRYADMLVRTKLTEARNTGLATRMLENKNDLVQVSINDSDHQVCLDWEGRILSLTGKTDGYPTVDEATNAGLFHPNCKHTINPIEPKLAKETYGFNTATGEYEQGVINND